MPRRPPLARRVIGDSAAERAGCLLQPNNSGASVVADVGSILAARFAHPDAEVLLPAVRPLTCAMAVSLGARPEVEANGSRTSRPRRNALRVNAMLLGWIPVC